MIPDVTASSNLSPVMQNLNTNISEQFVWVFWKKEKMKKISEVS